MCSTSVCEVIESDSTVVAVYHNCNNCSNFEFIKSYQQHARLAYLIISENHYDAQAWAQGALDILAAVPGMGTRS